MKFLRLSYGEFGEIGEVLRLESADGPEKLADGEVLIELIAAPVHPSDIGMITGRYGCLPKLPAIGGREGIGKIVGAGAGCGDLIGKIVKMPLGSWSDFAVEKAENLFFVPDGIDPYQASMAFINPLTAWMLLTSMRRLNPGDWIIQNAANSAVGIAVIQLAKNMGVRTVNLVRSAGERRPFLESNGATLVFEDEAFDQKTLKSHTDGALPFLGLNSIGGESAMKIIKSVDRGGEVVTFGGMVGDKVRFPTRELIFNDLRLRGFWLDKWAKEQSHGTLQSMYDGIFDLIARGIIRIPVNSTVKLSNSPEALISAIKGKKDGKILVVR